MGLITLVVQSVSSSPPSNCAILTTLCMIRVCTPSYLQLTSEKHFRLFGKICLFWRQKKSLSWSHTLSTEGTWMLGLYCCCCCCSGSLKVRYQIHYILQIPNSHLKRIKETSKVKHKGLTKKKGVSFYLWLITIDKCLGWQIILINKWWLCCNFFTHCRENTVFFYIGKWIIKKTGSNVEHNFENV